MILKFKEFITEGLTDKMTPVSKEDIEDKMGSLSVEGKLKAFREYKIPHNLSKKEIDDYYKSLEYEGEYLILKPSENGLTILLTKEGKEELDDLWDSNEDVLPSQYNSLENKFYDLMEDIQGNSDYEFHDNVGNSGIGMSDAPAITDGYYSGDNDEWEAHDEDSVLYIYNNYVYHNFIEVLYEKGEVYFTKI